MALLAPCKSRSSAAIPSPTATTTRCFAPSSTTLEQNGHGVVATDLYREGFAPAMTVEERRTYMGNDYDDSAVAPMSRS